MKNLFFKTILIIFFNIFFFSTLLNAKTSITVDLLGGVTLPDGVIDIAEQFQDIADQNGPNYANAYAFANILGYPIGKATLGTFPHFELGTALGAGLTNMEYFDEDSEAQEEGAFPGIAPTPVLHFGIGLAGGFDVIGKFFSFHESMIDREFEYGDYALEEFTLYTIGGKIRYNWLKEATIIPFVLNFGGLTFSLGGDLMRGKVSTSGSYEAEFEEINVNGFDTTMELQDANYVASLEWYQLSCTAQALIYFDVLYLFSVYTGFGLSWGYGWFGLDFDAAGTVVGTSGYTGDIGTIAMTSENKYNPQTFLPTSIIGLELNFGFIKVTAETMVNMRNRSDVSALLGARIQI